MEWMPENPYPRAPTIGDLQKHLAYKEGCQENCAYTAEIEYIFRNADDPWRPQSECLKQINLDKRPYPRVGRHIAVQCQACVDWLRAKLSPHGKQEEVKSMRWECRCGSSYKPIAETECANRIIG